MSNDFATQMIHENLDDDSIIKARQDITHTKHKILKSVKYFHTFIRFHELLNPSCSECT